MQEFGFYTTFRVESVERDCIIIADWKVNISCRKKFKLEINYAQKESLHSPIALRNQNY